MIHFHNLWYILSTNLSHCRLPSSEKVQGYTLEMSWKIFCNSLNTLKVYKSPKNIELHTIQAVMCHTGNISRHESYLWALKKSQGRPYETSCNIFCDSFKLIGVYKSPKNTELYTTFFVTQVPYHAIKLIVKSWKKSQGRPNETSCNRFSSTNLQKTLNHIQKRVIFVTKVPYHAIKVIIKS